tara:strand:- start:14 stop:175 length:162 start_codon:yes stop_codon:yes gene_type:complete
VDEGEKATDLIALRVLPRQKLILHKLAVLRVLMVVQSVLLVAILALAILGVGT